jgi:hypothetical protein
MNLSKCDRTFNRYYKALNKYNKTWYIIEGSLKKDYKSKRSNTDLLLLLL